MVYCYCFVEFDGEGTSYRTTGGIASSRVAKRVWDWSVWLHLLVWPWSWGANLSCIGSSLFRPTRRPWFSHLGHADSWFQRIDWKQFYGLHPILHVNEAEALSFSGCRDPASHRILVSENRAIDYCHLGWKRSGLPMMATGMDGRRFSNRRLSIQ